MKAEASAQSSATATSFSPEAAAERQREPSFSRAASARRESIPSGSMASSTPASPRISLASCGTAASACPISRAS